jgi:putative FmdB family regulatory protein
VQRILQRMATYEYMCLACEHAFEQRRAMTSAVQTAAECPSCGSERVRRRFSVFATGSAGRSAADPAAGGGCACGGACACRSH